jgi:predicted metal-dependent hydrolase
VSRALDWLPREEQLRLTILRGKRWLRTSDYFQAYRAFVDAEPFAADEDERELVRGLVHLAAAGYKRKRGDGRGAERQLAHARRRLAPHGDRLAGLGIDPP